MAQGRGRSMRTDCRFCRQSLQRVNLSETRQSEHGSDTPGLHRVVFGARAHQPKVPVEDPPRPTSLEAPPAVVASVRAGYTPGDAGRRPTPARVPTSGVRGAGLRTVVTRTISLPRGAIDRLHRVRRIDPRRFGGDLRAALRMAGRTSRPSAHHLAAPGRATRPRGVQPAVAGPTRSLPVVRFACEGLAVTLRGVRRCPRRRLRRRDRVTWSSTDSVLADGRRCRAVGVDRSDPAAGRPHRTEPA